MNNSNAVPFLDLVTPHVQLESELLASVQAALRSGYFIGGPAVQQFEVAFAEYCQAKLCVGVANGTDALRLTYLALGITCGDVVLTVPHTFIATTESISQTGARVQFIDIDEATYNLDPFKLRTYLETMCYTDAATKTTRCLATGERVKAVVPVHIYGQMADMDPIMEIAEEFGLLVIEDAAQAHGAKYYSERKQQWLTAGSIGVAGCFSFYPGKNLGACGEAGAVVTGDAELAARIRMYRDHGQRQKYFHEVEGYNGRLDAIQAGMLSVKLQRLAMWTEQRQQAALRYNSLLAQNDLIRPFQPEWSNHVYHLYVVRTTRRDEMITFLGERGIGTGIHYPVPLHLQVAYKSHFYKVGDFPVAESVASEIVSLPMFPQITEDQQVRVAAAVKEFEEVLVYG
jgi:dTDP-4-amino-4,6-dideoxygalactose transaminase